MVPTLPKDSMPSREQRAIIERHVAHLDRVLLMTPYEADEHGELTMVTVTKMMMVLPSKESGDLVAEAKGEAYMAALEDVPSWAVQEAMRKWHRAEYGPKHDYKWQPAPATLRELAMIEAFRVKGVRRKLADVVIAEPLLEFSADHCKRMKAKLSNLTPLKSMSIT